MLNIEDIEVGDWIVALKPQRHKLVSLWGDGLQVSTDRSYMKPMRVLVLDLPLAVVQWRDSARPVSVNLLEHDWKKLSPEFVAALNGPEVEE